MEKAAEQHACSEGKGDDYKGIRDYADADGDLKEDKDKTTGMVQTGTRLE